MGPVRALCLSLALTLALGWAGGHPQPCGSLARFGVPASGPGAPGSPLRLGVLLPRAPAARARVRAALARAPVPRNQSLELLGAGRDPASLARGLCGALAGPVSVWALLAFPDARPELLQLHFLAATARTPVLSLLRREARAPLGAPTPFHLQLDWACPLDVLLTVLAAVLRAHVAAESVGLALCRVRDPGGLVALWTLRAGRAPALVLELERPPLGPEGPRARLAPLAALPAAVLLGCEGSRALRLLRAAPPGPRWLLGTPLPAQALPTHGLPAGLLALGEAGRPPLEAAVHDALELLERAREAAWGARPEGRPEPPSVDCASLPPPGSAPESPGSRLARSLAHTAFQGRTGPVWVSRASQVHLSRRFRVWTLRRDTRGAPAWAALATWRDGRLSPEPGAAPRPPPPSPPPPPRARPRLRVVTLVEHPFVFAREPDADGRCAAGQLCLDPGPAAAAGLDALFAGLDDGSTPRARRRCCYGYCIDLLRRLAADAAFAFELYLVADGNLGILVRARDSAAPLGAFMWPLHWSMWLGVFGALHLTALVLTLFEWASPFGLTPRGRNRATVFSCSSALNLCYALLFGRSGASKTPKCPAGRLLMNLWAIFCLLVLSSYTANLAAVMVGDKTFEQLSGIHDPKLHEAARDFRVGTVWESSAEAYIKKSFPELHARMRRHSAPTTPHGVAMLASDPPELNAFIMDKSLLDYEVSIDPDCKLLTVGKPFAIEGYGIGLPRNSPLTSNLSEFISRYKSSGFIDLLHDKWYKMVPCGKRAIVTETLQMGAHHFSGLFVLLGLGLASALLTLLGEHAFYRLVLPRMRRRNRLQYWLHTSQRIHRALNTEPPQGSDEPVCRDPEELPRDTRDTQAAGQRGWRRVRRTVVRERERRVRFLLEPAAQAGDAGCSEGGPARLSPNGRPATAPAQPGELEQLEHRIEAARERLRQALLRRGELWSQLGCSGGGGLLQGCAGDAL
ncbi:glutamate receptor ionotropic, NMDA 3B isoform X2 [Erinaceus europaeus]|uniref:Glutamate receptor ionotropic, NMDA 3B isoform X2 n=1 Tax=Erinaceus europaeus TaxID=9365 RepID=A0ABM3WLJ0_ERIEU|nr:glutamate receptor ionotropic, NMDA 3B isoform X2 [Erinaceus europaeus]